ncbi:hypothetical protein V8B97DRAFT_2068385 [Scleroderma yunnanense]
MDTELAIFTELIQIASNSPPGNDTTTSSPSTLPPRRSRTLPPTSALAAQVGGHSGVQTTEDGSLLLKPALPREVAFYQLVRDGTNPDIDGSLVTGTSGLSVLLPWIPKFIGLLSLEGRLEEPDVAVEGLAPKIVPANGTYAPTQTLVLENLTYGFVKPCILDVKLGTILYDEDASPEKKERMIRTAERTTSLTTGIRLTGFQVYANDHPDPIVTPKAYGKSIKPEHLPEGIARFFPVHPSSTSTSSASESATAPTTIQPGMPRAILLVLLAHLVSGLERLRAALAEAEVRIVGGSVLILYEGDWARAEEAARTLQDPTSVCDSVGIGPGEDSSLVEDEDDEEVEVEIDESGQVIFDTATDIDSDEEKPPPRLATLSLIDFAHTRLAPGQGPDTGVLLGIDTLVRLVRERHDAIKALTGDGNL